MPVVRKLTPEETHILERRTKGARRLVEEQYDALLAGFEIGEYGEVTPGPGENRTTVRNRLRAAAIRRELALVFLRTRGDAIRFRIEDGYGFTPTAVVRRVSQQLDETGAEESTD